MVRCAALASRLVLALVLFPHYRGGGVKTISSTFRLYYQQEIVKRPDAQVLEFLRNAGRKTPEQVLPPGNAQNGVRRCNAPILT
jgi:hypothetical protein